MVKYDDVDEETINTGSQKTEEQKVEDKIIAKSHFIIDISENIVLYTEVKNHISKTTFLKIFSDLLTMGLADKGVNVELNAITDVYTFYETLSKLNKINSLKLTIYPTNPYPDDIIKELDEKLKSQQVRKKTISYKAKPAGLKLDAYSNKESVYDRL